MWKSIAGIKSMTKPEVEVEAPVKKSRIIMFVRSRASVSKCNDGIQTCSDE